VEFYFSDSNLPMDKFLLSQVGGSANLSVDLKIIHSFKRMRRFQPFSAIPAALKESKFLELTDDDTKVKRKEPLSDKLDPEEMDPNSIKVFEDRAMPRSIYAKGFGEEDKNTQLDIEHFFTPYGPWNAVRLRRANDKLFKGSVFVEFDSEETQKKFLELDPKPKYKGKDLQIMSKKAYCDRKVDDIKSGKVKPNGQGPYRGRGGYQNKRKRDDEDDRDWRERREDDRKNGFRDSRRGERDRGGKSGRDQGKEVRRDAR
jgi:lupus La protein